MSKSETRDQRPETPLQGWKEIAAYLKRDERTARRWELSDGLPIRRHGSGSHSSVYAYASELEQWRASRETRNEPSHTRRWVPAIAAGLALAVTGWLIVDGPILNPPDSMAEAADGDLRAELVWPDAEGIGAPQGSVSPDGRFLTYNHWDSNGNLAMRDLTTGETRMLTTDANSMGGDNYSYVNNSRISPNGKWVAYSWARSSPAGETIDLRLLPLEGENAEPRTVFAPADGEEVQVEDWFPDNDRVVALLTSDDSERIVVIHTGSGEIQQIRSVDWGVSGAIRVSPDGEFLAYSRTPSNGVSEEDIFVLAADGRMESAIAPHPADDELLGWSPDGSHVLFNSDRSGQRGLWAQRVDSGQPAGEPFLVVANLDAARGMGMTRDGSLYYSARLWHRRLKIATLDMRTGKLIGQPEDAAERRLGFNSRAVFSPDGKKLAYISGRQRSNSYDESVIVIRDLETGEERDLNHGLRRLWKIFWRPDGGAISVARLYTDLQSVDPATGKASFLAGADLGSMQRAAWSPDGRRIYYRHYEGDALGKLFAYNMADGSHETVLEGLEGIDGGLSPDGKWYASVERTEDSRQIVLRSLTGEEDRLLWEVQGPVRLGNWAVWTPDGEAVLVRRTGPGSEGTLWIVPVDDSQPIETELRYSTGGGDGIFPVSINLDGKRIVYSTGSYVQQIWALRNIPFDQWEEQAE